MYLSVFLKDRDKESRRQETVRRILPLNESLVSAELSILCPYYGLIVDLDMTVIECMVNGINDILLHAEFVAELVIVFAIILVELLLDTLAGITGIVTCNMRIASRVVRNESACLESELKIGIEIIYQSSQ